MAFTRAAFLAGVSGDLLVRGGAGRWFAGATLLLAAAYELSPFEDVCLRQCRSPLGFLLGAWRDGRLGALRMGTRHGAWCVGCCWALMASMFALGVMSVTWLAVAGLIALEKTLPWRRMATHGRRPCCSLWACCCSPSPTPFPPLPFREPDRWTAWSAWAPRLVPPWGGWRPWCTRCPAGLPALRSARTAVPYP